MDYIYARVSTSLISGKQETDHQTYALIPQFPDAIVITEHASGIKDRPELRRLISMLKRGDRVIVAALDRIGRSTLNSLQMLKEIEDRGATLISMRENFGTGPAAQAMREILLSIAQLERNLISSRTRAALANAKAKGKKLGRPKALDPAVIERGLELVEGGLSIRKAAAEVGMSFGYLRRLMRARENVASDKRS